jgi:hypothetical protein
MLNQAKGLSLQGLMHTVEQFHLSIPFLVGQYIASYFLAFIYMVESSPIWMFAVIATAIP